jgi:hypothetical protein
MADRTLTHSKLVQFHNDIATAHNGINGFYRFNWNELQNKFRSGIGKPALLLESYSAQIEENQNNTTNFNSKDMSILIIDFAGKADDYNKQEEVLDRLENVVLDVISYLKKEHKNRDSILFGMLEANSFSYEKVGPLFDNMHGWNLLYRLKNHEPMCFNPDKWTFTEGV